MKRNQLWHDGGVKQKMVWIQVNELKGNTAGHKWTGTQEKWENIPVCVQTGDGGLPVAVQMLRLLQEDVVEHPGDVDSDVILYWLKYSHVGADAGQQLTGLCYLLSCLVVHGHPHYGPRIRAFPLTSAAPLGFDATFHIS